MKIKEKIITAAMSAVMLSPTAALFKPAADLSHDALSCGQYNSLIITEVTSIHNNGFWGYEYSGAEQLWNDPDIDKSTVYSTAVKVGVIDSGIQTSIGDLAGRVDTALSRDFTGGSSPFTDEDGHGTFVAGIIGAKQDNYNANDIDNTQTIGVCKEVSLVSLKVDVDSNNCTAQIVQAINYANEMNIPILNFSITLKDSAAFRTAVSNYNGLIVCAAGNDYLNIDNYPTYPSGYDYDNVMSVGEYGIFDFKNDINDLTITKTFSNYGSTSVDVFAPGESIVSTHIDGAKQCQSGTSFATPFVTGAAALVLAHNPAATPYVIKKTLIDSVDKVDGFDDYCVSGGVLNIYNAYLNGHTYSYTKSSSKYHTKQCLYCGNSAVQELHTFVTKLGKSICARCGYTTTSYLPLPGGDYNSIGGDDECETMCLHDVGGELYVLAESLLPVTV